MTNKQKAYIKEIRRVHGLEKRYCEIKPIKRGLLLSVYSDADAVLRILKGYGFKPIGYNTYIARW